MKTKFQTIMKKGLFIIVFLTLSLVSFAQQDTEVKQNVLAENEIERVDATTLIKFETNTSKAYLRIKAKVLKMNRKKSNEIISIKAYRKSLQIKVKTIKLC